MKKGYLVLEDGSVFEGERFGSDTPATGELVFSTNVCGYIETLTDPSYYGQIVLQTFPLIGNYGIMESDFEGTPALKGYVVREYCDTPSNFRCEYDLDTYLKNNGIPGLCGVDTREITKIIRDKGVMNAIICDEIPEFLTNVKEFTIANPVKAVSRVKKEIFAPSGDKKYSVTLIDYGTRKYIVDALTQRGCEVTCVPYNTPAEDILSTSPDGVILSCGPGNPEENTDLISEVKKLMGKVPLFGIGLGHQLMALADGAFTAKLKYGHRGGNQPVKGVFGERTYITTQNHGYAVITESLKTGKSIFVNLNDNTCEGIEYPGKKAFSVQFYPDSGNDPLGTSFIFDKFIQMMGGEN